MDRRLELIFFAIKPARTDENINAIIIFVAYKSLLRVFQ